MKHGQTGSIEYSAWAHMRARCNNPKNSRYKDYGGRGIRVCRRWERFDNFLADMGKRPSKLHSLDRINVNGGYKKKNCRWSTRAEQARNSRRVRWITFQGKRKCFSDWVSHFGIPNSTVRKRLSYGWSFAEAVGSKRRIRTNGTHKYGVAATREHSIWTHMLQRCGNPKCDSFGLYGGRGISVCKRWMTFANFRSDMGVAPDGFTLDRINSRGNYSRSNCRWASPAQQTRNRSVTRWISHRGQLKCLTDLANEFSIHPTTLGSRLKRGITVERAILQDCRNNRSAT